MNEWRKTNTYMVVVVGYAHEDYHSSINWEFPWTPTIISRARGPGDPFPIYTQSGRFYHIRFQSIIKWKKKTDTKSKSVSKSKFHWYPYRIHWSSIRWTLDRRSGQTSHCGMEARQLRNPGVFKGLDLLDLVILVVSFCSFVNEYILKYFLC